MRRASPPFVNMIDMIGADTIYPGTPIEWLPESCVSVWRFLFFIMNIYVLVQFATMTWGHHSPLTRFTNHFTARSFMWIWIGCALFLLRTLAVQIERFGDKAVYEGLPVQTVIVLCIWRGVHL